MEDIRVFSLTGIRRIEVQLSYGVPACACPTTRFDSLVLIYTWYCRKVASDQRFVHSYQLSGTDMVDVVAHRLTLCMYSQRLSFPG